MQLAVGHAATLKPAVKDLLHAVQLPLALLAGDGDVVYEVPVQVCHLQAHVTGHMSPGATAEGADRPSCASAVWLSTAFGGSHGEVNRVPVRACSRGVCEKMQ